VVVNEKNEEELISVESLKPEFGAQYYKAHRESMESVRRAILTKPVQRVE